MVKMWILFFVFNAEGIFEDKVDLKSYTVTKEVCNENKHIALAEVNILDYWYLEVIWCEPVEHGI